MDRKIEIDIEVSEKIFNRTPCKFRNTGTISGLMNFYACKHPDPRNCYPSNPDAYNLIPKYSIDMSCAWLIVEEMKNRDYSFACWDVIPISSVQPRPLAAFKKGVHLPDRMVKLDVDAFYASCETMAESICRAALNSINWEEKENENKN